MLNGVETCMLLYAETHIYRYVQQRHHNNIIASTASLRVVPIRPPFQTPLLPLASLQTTSNMSTSEEEGYSEKVEVFHAPQPGCPRDRESSLEIPLLETGWDYRWRVPVTRQETHHHSTTRAHQPKRSTRRFAQRTRRTNHHRTRGRLDACARQPQGSATSFPPPISTGHHRRHLGSPRSAERHLCGFRDLGVHADPFDLAYTAARTQRAPDHGNH